MEKQIDTLALVTDTFPAHWRHADDDTECDRPEVCHRMTYVRGGRPNFGEPQ
jgi:hypothetical protein